jgi:uncharacterized phage-associated protein
MFDVVELSWFILKKCADNGTPISNLQLQKMLYFLQKINLEKKGIPLFNEKIRAWQFGPVVREAYYTFSAFSSLRIIPTEYNPNPKNIVLDDFLLDEITKRANQKPWDLVDETHQAGKAWDKIYKNGKGNDKVIPLELIKNNG